MATVPSATFTHTAEEIDAAVDAVAGKASQEDLDALAEAVEGKQDALTFDSTPTSGSDNPVKSKGIKSYVDTGLSGKQDALTFDSTPTANSDNPVKSGGVKTYVDTAVSGLIGINDVYGLGTTIPDNADIDADPYLTPGVHIRTSNQNSSIHGIPVNGYAFKLIVE